MVALIERPPVKTRRTNYRCLYRLHTAVLQAALACYKANAITREMFADVLISFCSQFANEPNEEKQIRLCRGFLKALKGKVYVH